MDDYFQMTHIDIPDENMVQMRQRNVEEEVRYDKKYHLIEEKIKFFDRPKKTLFSVCKECEKESDDCLCVFWKLKKLISPF